MSISVPVHVCGALILSIAVAGPVAAQDWQVMRQPGGYLVARTTGAGAVGSVGITCERSTAIMAFRLARPAARSPTAATVAIGGISTRLMLIRNGTSDVWVAAQRDRALLDAIAGSAPGSRMAIVVDGAQAGVLPLGGARAAMLAALRGCYAPGDSREALNTEVSGTPTTVADERSPETAQTSFPIRDPKSGAMRLPVRLGAYVEAPRTCGGIRGEGDFLFVDAGLGVGDGNSDAQNSIQAIRQLGAGSYSIRENVGTNGDFERNATYTVADPEHFSVQVSRGKPKRYSYCAQSSLPIELRSFLGSEYRIVRGVPITPGYYEVFASDEPGNRATRCAEMCGYIVVGRTGIAMAVRYAYSEDRRVQHHRFQRVVQTAPQSYVAYAGVGDDAYQIFFEVRGPDDFASPPDGEGLAWHYRRVEPSAIPAAMMPRF